MSSQSDVQVQVDDKCELESTEVAASALALSDSTSGGVSSNLDCDSDQLASKDSEETLSLEDGAQQFGLEDESKRAKFVQVAFNVACCQSFSVVTMMVICMSLQYYPSVSGVLNPSKVFRISCILIVTIPTVILVAYRYHIQHGAPNGNRLAKANKLKEGDVLTVGYGMQGPRRGGGGGQSAQQRKQNIQERFAIECTCTVCGGGGSTLPPASPSGSGASTLTDASTSTGGSSFQSTTSNSNSLTQ